MNDEQETHQERKGRMASSNVTCSECQTHTPIYQCPACLARTCSLNCCQDHKKRTGCTGKRNRGGFVPVSRMTDRTLRSDYFFLEEVLQHLPGHGKRLKTEDLSSQKQTANSKKSRRLVEAAERRGITLQIMPAMMARHQSNSSWYCTPKDTITWKVEVIVHPSKELVTFNLPENEENLADQISKHFKKANIVTSLGDYRLFIKRLPSNAKHPLYRKLGASDCLKTALRGMTIVEHPTIHYVPRHRWHEFSTDTDKIAVVDNQASIAT